MTNSIVSRFFRLFKAGANDALDAVEDPGAIARQMVRDFTTEIAKHEEAVVGVIGEQKLLTYKRDAAKTEASDWNAKATQAVKANRDDLARAALERAALAEKKLNTLEKSLSILTPKIDSLKLNLADLRKKKDEADNEASMIAAVATAAKATRSAAQILSGIGSNSVDLHEVRERADRMEASAEAMGALALEKNGGDIDAELAALSDTTVDDRLAVLKAKVQKDEK